MMGAERKSAVITPEDKRLSVRLLLSCLSVLTDQM